MINKTEVFTVAFIVALLVAILIPQCRKENRREAKSVEDYNHMLDYQRAERAREEENRRVVRIFKDRYFNLIADAIFRAEGGRDTRYPYGIKSVLVHGELEARTVCLNTIESSWSRYEHTDCTDFIAFLADTYCPIATDPVGNGNWIANVRYFVNNPKPLP